MTVVWGYSVLTVGWLVVWQAVARRLVGLRFVDALLDTLPFMIVALAVMAATYYLTAWIDGFLLLLVVRIMVAALLYFAVMKVAKVKILEDCIQALRH